MFCINCGVELYNGAKFCGKCGMQVPIVTTANGEMVAVKMMPQAVQTQPSTAPYVMQQNHQMLSDKKNNLIRGLFLVLMAVAVAWVLISGFVPVVEGGIPFLVSGSWSFFSIRDFLDFLVRKGLDSELIGNLLNFCTITYVIGVLMAILFFVQLFAKNKSEKVRAICSVISNVFCGIPTVVIIIVHFMINSEMRDYMLGADLLSILPVGWITIAVVGLNVVFASMYLKLSDHKSERIDYTEWKKCQLCKTEYVGATCPSCGSYLTEK